jgi:hypothetical protein
MYTSTGFVQQVAEANVRAAGAPKPQEGSLRRAASVLFEILYVLGFK